MNAPIKHRGRIGMEDWEHWHLMHIWGGYTTKMMKKNEAQVKFIISHVKTGYALIKIKFFCFSFWQLRCSIKYWSSFCSFLFTWFKIKKAIILIMILLLNQRNWNEKYNQQKFTKILFDKTTVYI